MVEPKRAGTRFVEDGVRELLKARRVLCGSYVHGYYLQDNGYNRTIFEFMQVACVWGGPPTRTRECPSAFTFQNELEEVTEKLSEMVARPYLRTPRALIIQTTALARRKRHEFVRAVAKGLIPPESPPPARRRPHDDVSTSTVAYEAGETERLRVVAVTDDARHRRVAAAGAGPGGAEPRPRPLRLARGRLRRRRESRPP